MNILKEYSPFLRIISFYYSDIRLVNTRYDQLDTVFLSELEWISKKFLWEKYVWKNTLTKLSQAADVHSIEWYFFKIIASINKLNLSDLIDETSLIGNINEQQKKDLLRFYDLIHQTNLNDNVDAVKNLDFLIEIDMFLYNLFASIFTTFRHEKDLIKSVSYINKLIEIKPQAASFYLFRIRNLFLYYYQTVIWVWNFNEIIKTTPEKVLRSKYIKIIFHDIEFVRKMGTSNPVLSMFEGNILIHLHNKRWVEIISKLIDNNSAVDKNNCHEWIWNYYLYTWSFQLAEDYYRKIYPIDFKIHRKLIATYISSKNFDGLSDLLSNLNKDYKFLFYVSDNAWEKKHNSIITNISKIKYNTINIPLDISLHSFVTLHEEYLLSNKLSIFFNHIREDIHKYYLHQSSISILLIDKENK